MLCKAYGRIPTRGINIYGVLVDASVAGAHYTAPPLSTIFKYNLLLACDGWLQLV